MKPDQLSQTAAFVAIKFYGLTRIDSYRSLFDDKVIRFYEQMVPALPAPLRYYHFWLKFRWVRALYIRSEELLLPGDLMHILTRKWQIQQTVATFIDKNYEQLVVLGAGFDHLAYYHSGNLPCFEIDTPYMGRLKQRFLDETCPADPHPEIIAAHFPDDNLEDTLHHQQKIDPNKKTIIVAEGFIDYLNTKTVTSTLSTIQNYFSDKTALVSTHFALDELSSFHRLVFKSSVSLVGEDLQLKIPIAEFKKMLIQQGYEIQGIYDAQEMRNRMHKMVKSTLPVLDGFYILSGIVNANI